MKKNTTKLISKVLVAALLLGIVGALTACGASSSPSYQNAPSYKNDALAGASTNSVGSALDDFFDFNISESESIAMAPSKAPQEPTQEESDTNQQVTEDYLNSQKLIYTCSIEIESLEFAATQAKIQELIKQYGGFIESNRLYDNAYGWYYESYEKTTGTLTQELRVRIPSNNYDAFVNGVSVVGKVQHKTENVQNITTQYNDTSTTIKSLEAQEERLLSMMAECVTIDDMIIVERRLSEVQMQLERYQTQLNSYDMNVQFSTVNITLSEVREYSPTYEEKTFFERFAEHIERTVEDFGEFMEGALFVVVYLFPYGVLTTIIVMVVYKIIKKRRTHKLATMTCPTPINPATKEENLAVENDKKQDVSVQTEVGAKKKDKK